MGTTPAPPGTAQITGTEGSSSVRSVPPTPATGCPATQPYAALGPGTVHEGPVTTNETWTLEGSPHKLPHGIQVAAGASITVMPCAVVLLAQGQSVDVQDGAGITAVGDAAHPIRFDSDNATPQPGDWNGVYIAAHARATSRLAFVTIAHAGQGSPTPFEAGLHVALPGLDAQSVTLQDNRGYGVALEDDGNFAPAARDLRVTGSVARGAPHSGAIAVNNVDALRTLPTGTYTPNEVNEVYVLGSAATAQTTGTWPNLGVRYRFADNLDVRIEGPAGPIITIAPGTTLAFGSASSLAVGWDAQGALIADGRAEQTRITFTQAGNDPQPAQWEGIYLGERFNRSQTRLNYVTISYAGQDSSVGVCRWSDDAADQAMLYIQAAPTPQTLAHAQFVGAPPNGAAIARNFPPPAVNFADRALGNDFTHLGARCRQAPAHQADGNCPEPRACD